MSYDPNQYGQYQPNPEQPQSQYGQPGYGPQYQPQPGQPGYGPQYQPQPGQPGYGPQYQPNPEQPGYGSQYQPQPEQPSYDAQYGQYQQQQPQYQQQGQYQQQPQYQQQFGVQQKDWLTTLLLCIFLGGIGVHRFYTGHTAIGVVQLLTAGGCGIWTLVDLIMIITDNFKDSNGLPLRKA